jgi:ribosomal-protein-alanine N-acetyltransferase
MTGPPMTLPPDVVIEALRPRDVTRCAALEEVLFRGEEPWSAASFLDELRAGHNTYVAARIGGELVGYGGVAVVGASSGAEAEIHTIGVDPAHQGRGIGRALLRALLAAADAQHATVFLEVRTDNDPARTLYESEGFTVVGLRRRYYRPSGADAHTMRREPR